MESKACNKCGETKSVIEFYQRSGVSGDAYHTSCKACHNETSRKNQSDKPFKYHSGSVHRRAKAKGLSFDLDADYLESIWTGTCPVFHTRLDLPYSGNHGRGAGLTSPHKPSLDRIRPDKGYVKGNVIWISSKANIIKSDASSDEILAVGRWLQQTEEEIERHETN